MPGTLLLEDFNRANEDDLREHVQQLFQPPTPSDTLTNPLGTGTVGVAPVPEPVPQGPTPSDVLTNPPVVERTPQELQDHVAQLLAPPEQPTPAPEAMPPAPAQPPAPSTVEPLTPAAPDAVVTQLADHVANVTGGGLQLLGQGLTSLGQGAQQTAGNVISLVPKPAPAAPTPGAQPNATDAVPLDTASGRVFPVQGYTGQVDYHWGAVKGGSDLFAPRGTPVVAMAPGKVLESGWNDVGGNAVLIRGTDGNEYYYAHLDAAPAVKVGQDIGAGTFLGPVGDTGDAKGRGTHLHIGIGPDIKLGADKYGGTGGDFDAVSLLRSALAPSDQRTTSVGGPVTRTTAELSGGGQGTGALTDRAQQLLSAGGQVASWLGDQGSRAVQAILVTEGGLTGARGDQGKSAGPLQFYEGGQLASFALEHSMNLDQAKSYVEQHPLEAIQWAVGTPDRPGYLGQAILRGQRQGLSGADLATYAQRIGQVSVSPERAGQNFLSLFGSGQAPVFMGANQPAPEPTPTDQRMAEVEQPRPLQLLGQGLSALGTGAQNAQHALGEAAGGFTAPGGPVGQLAQNVSSAASQGLQVLADTSQPQTAQQQPIPSDVLTNPLGTRFTGTPESAQLRGQPAAGMPPPREGPSVLPALDQAQQALRAGDMQGALDALGQAREAVATSAVGPVLGMLKSPSLMSDAEVLALPEAQTTRQIWQQQLGDEPINEHNLAEYTRAVLLGQAAAGTHETPGGRFAPGGREALTGQGMLRDALTELDVYPREIAASIRDWATTVDARASQVASTVRRWTQENPLATVPERVSPAVVERAVTELETNLRRGGGGAPLPGGTQPGQLGLPGEEYQPIMQPPGEGGFHAPELPPTKTGPSIEQLRIIEEQRRINAERAARGPEAPLSREEEALARSRTTESGQVALPEMPTTTPGPRERLMPDTTPVELKPEDRILPTGLQQANTVRLAGMLSNTMTQLVNATGNLVNGATVIPDHLLSAGIDWARVAARGGQRERYVAETLPMIKAWGPGVIGNMREALQILKTGLSSEDMGKLERIAPGLNSYYTRVFGVPVGRLLTQRGGKVVDRAIEMPLRMLQAADVLFRGGAMNAHVNGLAVRQGLREGLRGPALAQRVGYIMQNLDQFPQLAKEAQDKAARAVFQEKREIPFVGRTMQTPAGQAMGKSDVGKFIESQVLPFTRTPYNITAQGAGRSPLGAAGVVSAARAGHVGEAEDRAARAILGTTTFGVALWMGAHGLLTGDRPDDSSTLPAGWRPWSVRVPVGDGAVYVPMQNFGAYGWPMAMAAIGTDAVHRGKSWADPSQLSKMATSIGSYVLDNTFLQGLSDTIDMLQDPKRFADRWAQGEAASFVPFSGMGRELENISGMVQRDPREGMQGILDAMAATNPLTAGMVPERTNALGDPVRPAATGAAAAVSPVRTSVEEDDPTLKVLRENGVGIQSIPDKINVPAGHVEITDEEQAQFKKARGDLLKRYVASEVRGADFQKGSAVAKNKYLSDAVSRANRDAKEQVITQWAADRAAWRARIQPKAVPEPYYVGGTGE